MEKKEMQKNLDSAEIIFDKDINNALQLVENNLLKAIKKEYKKEEGLAYQVLGKFNFKLKNYPLAVSNFEKSIVVFKKLKNKEKLFELHSQIADCKKEQSDNSKAIDWSNSANSYANDLNDRGKKISSNIQRGNLYLNTNENVKVKTSFQKSLLEAIIEKDSINICKAKIGLGKLAEKQMDYVIAKKYYTSSQVIAEKIENDELANESFKLLSDLAEKQNLSSEKIGYQQQALNYNTSRSNTNYAIQNSSELANSYLELGKKRDALKVLETNNKLLFKEKNTVEKREYVKTLTNVYEQQGKKEEAKKVKKEYDNLVDSYKKSEEEKKLAIHSKNELLSITQNKILLLEKDRELSEKTIELLKQEQESKNETIKKQKTITYILLSGLLIILIMAFFIYRSSKQKQISNQLLTLKSLRNQMNPHFIFNSLNSVNSFIAKKDEKSANKYLSEFSKLMREVLEYSQEDFIPLAKEIEILKLYLNLEHYRFKNDFDFTFTVANNIKVDDYQIPPMLLQPFIENAIWHGLRYKKEKGELNIGFNPKQNYVEIVISDNGIGREQSKLSKTLNQKKMKSTGIKNVKSRLEIIKSVFKKDLEISINNLDENTKEGTVVTVKLYA